MGRITSNEQVKLIHAEFIYFDYLPLVSYPSDHTSCVFVQPHTLICVPAPTEPAEAIENFNILCLVGVM